MFCDFLFYIYIIYMCVCVCVCVFNAGNCTQNNVWGNADARQNLTLLHKTTQGVNRNT